jgi:hypothetical protein
MELIRRIGEAFLRRVERWSRPEGREVLVEAVSAGPCPVCGQERLRVREARVDDFGYSVRIRDRWVCACDARPAGPDPAPDAPEPSPTPR